MPNGSEIENHYWDRTKTQFKNKHVHFIPTILYTYKKGSKVLTSSKVAMLIDIIPKK